MAKRTKTIRIDLELEAKVARVAEIEERTFSQTVERILRRAVEADKRIKGKATRQAA